MNKKNTTIAKTTLAAGAMLALMIFVQTTGAQGLLGGTSGSDAIGSTGSTYVDPCGASGGSGSTWTGPSTTPPGGNVAAPLNVSGTPQYKPAKLTLGLFPCPMPMTWTPGSMLTVNGITDTIGFSNWGASFLQGLTSVGATWTRPAGFPAAVKQPKLFVKADPLVGAPSPTNLPQAAAQFAGNVDVLGSLGVVQGNGTVASTTGAGAAFNQIYVQGVAVCLQNGVNCPASTGGGGGSQWTTSGANIYNNNSGLVGIGTSSPIHKLDVNGVINTNNNIYAAGQGIIAAGLRVGPGGAPANMLTVAGNADITGNLTVAGQNVCRQDRTNCPNPAALAFNLVYMIVPQGDARSGTAGSPYRACAGLSSSTSLSGTWYWAGGGGGGFLGSPTYYPQVTLTPYKYCRSAPSEGDYVWANPYAGKMFPHDL